MDTKNECPYFRPSSEYVASQLRALVDDLVSSTHRLQRVESILFEPVAGVDVGPIRSVRLDEEVTLAAKRRIDHAVHNNSLGPNKYSAHSYRSLVFIFD